MNYRELTGKLRRLGCAFVKQGRGDHEIWMNTKGRAKTTIPNWRGHDLREGTIRGILRDLGISKDDFDRA